MRAALKKLMLVLMLSASAATAVAQQAVKGTVKDDAGEPLIGVAVYVDGKAVTVTDTDGHFTLPAGTRPDSKVSVTYLGYKEQSATVGNGQPLVLVMETDDKLLDEIVMVGYSTMKKSDLTGAVSSVDNLKLNAKGAPSVIANLQGSIPGVNITQSSGRVGSSFNIEIRGKNSISSSQNPLYVVDGVICSDIDFLNPQDIERIDVLKDASSTAIYGSRASAGVVMVTTKSGSSAGIRASKPVVSYDGYYGVSQAAHMPDFTDGENFYKYRFMKFLNMAGASQNGGQPVWVNDDLERCLLSAGTVEEGTYRMIQLLDEGKTYNWPDFVLQKGLQQNHYLAVSGTDNHTHYHIGVGYMEEQGIFKNDDLSKFNIKASLETEVYKWLNAGVNVNLSRKDQNYASDNAVAYAFRINPFMQPYDENGDPWLKPGDKNALNTDMYQFTSQISPLIFMEEQSSNTLSWNGLGNVFLELKPIKGLSVKTTFSPTFGYSRYGYYQSTVAGESQNTAIRTDSRSSSYTWDNMAVYDRKLGDDHHLNLMGLVSYYAGNSESSRFSYNKVLDGTYWWALGTTDQGYNYGDSNTGYSESRLMSYAFRANYTFRGRYMLTGTVRRDGSSRFAGDHRWGSFPSAAAAWRLSEEPWMQADWLSNLKLRLSYGVSGNNSVGDYATKLYLSSTMYYPFGNTYYQGQTLSGIVDQDLEWEKSHETNLGLDFGFLKDRIRGSVDVYTKVSSDLLYSVKLPLEAGGASVTTNIGSVQNRGIEATLSTTNISTRNWTWETTFTFSHNENEVLEINGTGDYYSGGSTGNLFIGEPVNNVYGYVWDGIVSDRDMVVPDNDIAVLKGFTPGETVKEYAYYNACYGWVEGNPIIVDKNGDGKFTDDDKKVYKSDPDWIGSFSSTLRYKNLDFSFTVYAKQNYTVFSNFYNEYLNYDDRGRSKITVDWYIPAGTLLNCDGINEDGSFINPVYQETTHYGTYPFPNNGCANSGVTTPYWLGSTNSYTDASFVKVKNITLGYTFPKAWMDKIHGSSLRLYATVTNPFVFTDYMGYDPEWANSALKGDTPSTLTVQVGANIKF